MEYTNLTESVKSLDFIGEHELADAAVKAVFGVMASRMGEQEAREFTQILPEPLSFDKLRSHQEQTLQVDPDEYIEVIANQFNFNREQAENLVRNLLNMTKANLPDDKVESWENKLPGPWASLVEKS